MLLGLITDEINEYEIYLIKNKIRLQKITNDKKVFLSEIEAKKFFETILGGSKRFLKKHNNYDVYIDEAGNKRFFQNNEENFKLFFLQNGEDAVLYNDNKTYTGSRIKRFILKHKKTYYLICTIALFSEIGFLLTDVRSPLSDFRYSMENKVYEAFIGDYTSSDLINLIKNSKGENLTDAKKDYFANKDFIDDVITYGNTDRISILTEKLKNFEIDYFEEDYAQKEGICGKYKPINPNKIYIVDDSIEMFNCVSAHEFVHLMQQSFKYDYIKEASAEIFAWEYFNSSPESYLEQRKRVYLLTDIIGADLLFEVNFCNNTKNFENEIINLLGNSDGKELLKLFNTKPKSDNIDKVNEKIDNYLFKMYQIKYGQDVFFQNMWYIDKLYNDKYINDFGNFRFFFNRHDYRYYKTVINDYDNIKNTEVNLEEINDEEVIKIFLERYESVSQSEYENHKDFNMGYIKQEEAIKNYKILPDGKVINLQTKEIISRKEAKNRNLINTYYLKKYIEEFDAIEQIPKKIGYFDSCNIILSDGSFAFNNSNQGFRLISTDEKNCYYLTNHVDYKPASKKTKSI